MYAATPAPARDRADVTAPAGTPPAGPLGRPPPFCQCRPVNVGRDPEACNPAAVPMPRRFVAARPTLANSSATATEIRSRASSPARRASIANRSNVRARSRTRIGRFGSGEANTTRGANTPAIRRRNASFANSWPRAQRQREADEDRPPTSIADPIDKQRACDQQTGRDAFAALRRSKARVLDVRGTRARRGATHGRCPRHGAAPTRTAQQPSSPAAQQPSSPAAQPGRTRASPPRERSTRRAEDRTDERPANERSSCLTPTIERQKVPYGA